MEAQVRVYAPCDETVRGYWGKFHKDIEGYPSTHLRLKERFETFDELRANFVNHHQEYLMSGMRVEFSFVGVSIRDAVTYLECNHAEEVVAELRICEVPAADVQASIDNFVKMVYADPPSMIGNDNDPPTAALKASGQVVAATQPCGDYSHRTGT
eukprot:scaffold148473_cov20-Prasinocladus_malaysianus.AAC.2